MVEPTSSLNSSRTQVLNDLREQVRETSSLFEAGNQPCCCRFNSLACVQAFGPVFT